MKDNPVKTIWLGQVSLWRITQLFRLKISMTWGLLFIEACLVLLFPLAIGFSVDSLLQDSHAGLLSLGALSLAVLVVGASRRFYDTRIYAHIFQALANALVAHEKAKQRATSQISARINLLYEVIEFLENTLPMLMSNVIGFVGVVVIIALLDVSVMGLCLITSILIVVIYAFSHRHIFVFNQQQNDELEQQVDVISAYKKRRVTVHFKRMMKWNIKLSDLETLNFSLVWLLLGVLLILSIVLIVGNDSISYGQKITAIMYVYHYIELVMSFPLFYQQYVRLKEISQRLSHH